MISSGCSIGRSDDNDIILDSYYVSKHQAVMKYEENRWILTKVRSKNRTQVFLKSTQQMAKN